MAIIPVQQRGLMAEVSTILTSNWQPSAIIAAQVLWRPEAAQREVTVRRINQARGSSVHGAQSNLVARVLSDLYRHGKCERKNSSSHEQSQGLKSVYVYRKLQQRKTGAVCLAKLKEIGNVPVCEFGLSASSMKSYLPIMTTLGWISVSEILSVRVMKWIGPHEANWSAVAKASHAHRQRVK